MAVLSWYSDLFRCEVVCFSSVNERYLSLLIRVKYDSYLIVV